MSTFEIEPTPVEGLAVIRRKRHTDDRGFLERLFEEDALASSLGQKPVVQMNHTFTKSRGTIRGMHCQLPPCAESKIVTCINGSVFDVVVDLRLKSKTFGQWWSHELNEENGEALVIPEGCAHGLQTLVDNVDLIYMHTANHNRDSEAAINPMNSELGIPWPQEVTAMSDRDRSETRALDWFKGVKW